MPSSRNELRERLKGAKRRVKELEGEIQRFIDDHSKMDRRLLENHPTIRRLARLADNAERVVKQLELQLEKLPRGR
jgi:chromosome segregation ATPase